MTEEEIMKKAIESERTYFSCLDEVIFYLKSAKENGLNIYVEWNGRILYSLLDDEDSCYKKFTGLSKKDYQERVKEWKKKYENVKYKARLNKKNEFIERGKKVIYPQLHKSWEDYIEKNLNGEFDGDEIESALETMEFLDNGGIAEQGMKMLEKFYQANGSFAKSINLFCSVDK